MIEEQSRMAIKFIFIVVGGHQNLRLMGMGYRQHFGKNHAKQKIQ